MFPRGVTDSTGMTFSPSTRGSSHEVDRVEAIRSEVGWSAASAHPERELAPTKRCPSMAPSVFPYDDVGGMALNGIV
ncbi:MAG: hypothetical protein ACRDXC_03875, partial [Acidimicrobiales bacterium]